MPIKQNQHEFSENSNTTDSSSDIGQQSLVVYEKDSNTDEVSTLFIMPVLCKLLSLVFFFVFTVFDMMALNAEKLGQPMINEMIDDVPLKPVKERIGEIQEKLKAWTEEFKVCYICMRLSM